LFASSSASSTMTTLPGSQVARDSALPYRGRYAPTPSGPLHAGNLRTALLAWLLARHAGGAFALRVEDLDRPRVRPGATQAMLDDLRWLGLDWDEGPDIGGPHAPYVQSERDTLYAERLRWLQDRPDTTPPWTARLAERPARVRAIQVPAATPHDARYSVSARAAAHRRCASACRRGRMAWSASWTACTVRRSRTWRAPWETLWYAVPTASRPTS